MQTSTQLELNLWQQLEAANHQPEVADLERLWQGLEQALTSIPQGQRLQVAAEAIAQIAEVFCLRADLVLAALEVQDNFQGPVLPEDFLSGLMRQSMSIDVFDLKEEWLGPEPAIRPRSALGSRVGESVAGEVDKAALLQAFDSEIELVEVQAQAESAGGTVAHDEDMGGWARAIAQWFAEQEPSRPVSLIELQQELRMPLVEVWLGLLLAKEGSYQFMHLGKDFYAPQGVSVATLTPEVKLIELEELRMR